MRLSRAIRRRCSIGVFTGLLAVLPASGIATADSAAPLPGGGPFRHLQALQDIAAANGGNRAAGTPGYDRSADYVAEQLRSAGYAVRFEEFDFPFFEERAPPVVLAHASDGSAEPTPAGVRSLRNSGSGDVSARLGAVDLRLDAEPGAASNSGCEADDFGNFPRGAIALIRRGTCQFQVKVDNAVAAGAAGIIIMNEGTDRRVEGFSGQLSKPAAVPVVGVPYAFGRSLAAGAERGTTVRLAVDATTGMRRTRNVLAELAADDGSPQIIVGAHLDSVPEGPGINDNGSGVAAAIEAALQLAREPAAARGRVRFAFWGAEERGLVGSRYHVGALSEAERRRIAVYVNLDMVASPNAGRFVQRPPGDPGGLAGLVQRELVADFREQNVPVEERTAGRSASDDDAFSQKEIPTVGLYTSAGDSKSEDQARVFGGTAGPFDPCYHEACDTIANVNREALEQNTRALIRAVRAASVAAAATGAP